MMVPHRPPETQIAMTHPAPDEERVRTLLRQVVDPEVGANIVDLGLVYRIDIAPGRVGIAMTMTSPACPMGEMILDDVRAALADGLPPAGRRTSRWSGNRRGVRSG